MPKHKSTTPAIASRRSPNTFWLALPIVGATMVLFWSATRFGFVNLDDDLYVSENPHVSTGFNLENLRYAFTTTDGGSWMPLTWLSLLLDRALWGTSAAGFHATNVLLHALAAGLLYLVLTQMTREPWPCLVATLLFAVHPLRVESVVWIAERKDVLSAFFFMLMLHAYARYVAKPDRNRMALTLACLASGLMAKPMLVTAPFLLLLVDVWPLCRLGMHVGEKTTRWQNLIAEKIPLFIIAIAFAAVTFLTQRASGALLSETGGGLQQVLRVADNYGFYLCKLFWPHSLNVLYPLTTLHTGPALLALVLIVGICVTAWRFRQTCPWLMTGWFWFLIAMLPVSGVVPVGSTWVADRYSYLPSIGIAVAFAWTLEAFNPPTKYWRNIVTGLGVLMVASLVTVTVNNLPRWRDSISLFSDAAIKGDHPGAHQNLGVALAAQGDHASAIKHFTRALELNPTSAESYFNRANSFQALGETTRAMDDFSRAIELKPDYAPAYNNLGNLRAARGEFQQAIGDFTQAIALRPADTDALMNLAHAELELGQHRAAIDNYSRVISMRPDLATAYHDRAVAFYHLKDYERAWADLRICRRMRLTPSPDLIRRLETDSGRRE